MYAVRLTNVKNMADRSEYHLTDKEGLFAQFPAKSPFLKLIQTNTKRIEQNQTWVNKGIGKHLPY